MRVMDAAALQSVASHPALQLMEPLIIASLQLQDAVHRLPLSSAPLINDCGLDVQRPVIQWQRSRRVVRWMESDSLQL